MPFYSPLYCCGSENRLVIWRWAIRCSFSVISPSHMINDKPPCFIIFSFFAKNGFENEFCLPKRLLAKASFKISGSFSVRIHKVVGAFSTISRGRNRRFAAGQHPQGFWKPYLMIETALLHCVFRHKSFIISAARQCLKGCLIWGERSMVKY